MYPLITANQLTQVMSVVLFSLVALFAMFIGYHLPRADWGRLNFIRDDSAARLIVELLLVLAFFMLFGLLLLTVEPILYDLFGIYE